MRKKTSKQFSFVSVNFSKIGQESPQYNCLKNCGFICNISEKSDGTNNCVQKSVEIQVQYFKLFL